MIELIAALIGGIATVAAALISKKDDSTAGSASPTHRPPLTQFLALFVVGGLAGALLAMALVKAAEKGLLIGGYRIPPGTVVAYMGNSAPEGWLPCNGDPVDESHSDLKSLLVGGLTPDLRGRFPRGFDSTGKIDVDGKGIRALGSKQEDAFKKHSHLVAGVFIPGGDEHFDQGGKRVTSGGSAWTGNGKDDSGNEGGDETRPKNVAVNFIIKY